MKKHNFFLTLILIGIILHLGSTASHAGFLIGFHNGRTISVENYRIEGEQIFLDFNGGVVKFSRSEIKSILKEKDEIKEGKRGETSGLANETPRTPDKTVLVKDPVKTSEGTEDYRKKKVELSERLEEAKKNYFETSDKSDKERARKIMLSISRELFALAEEVTRKNNGVLPEWWKP